MYSFGLSNIQMMKKEMFSMQVMQIYIITPYKQSKPSMPH